jgi:hypothetical protein
MVLLDDVGQVEARFGTFGDIINLGAREVPVCAECTAAVETILGAPIGRPR